MAIRRPSPCNWSLEELGARGLFRRTRSACVDLDGSEEALVRMLAARDYEFLRLAVQTRRNIVVSGATGSGKTTFTRALIRDIPVHERLITIEDAAELALDLHPNHVRLFYSKGGQSGADGFLTRPISSRMTCGRSPRLWAMLSSVLPTESADTTIEGDRLTRFRSADPAVRYAVNSESAREHTLGQVGIADLTSLLLAVLCLTGKVMFQPTLAPAGSSTASYSVVLLFLGADCRADFGNGIGIAVSAFTSSMTAYVCVVRTPGRLIKDSPRKRLYASMLATRALIK